jgi:hypothetical protein
MKGECVGMVERAFIRVLSAPRTYERHLFYCARQAQKQLFPKIPSGSTSKDAGIACARGWRAD